MIIVTSNEKRIDYNDRPFIRIYSAKNIESYQNALMQIDWSQIYDSNNINESVSFLTDSINTLSNLAFPLVRCSRRNYRDKYWVNEDLKQKIRLKNNLFFNAKQSGTVENKMLYKTYKMELDKEIVVRRNEYYKNLLDSRTNSVKNIWKTLNHICSFKKTNSNSKISNIATPSGVTYDKLEIAEHFNDFFANIGTKLASKFDAAQSNYKDYLSGSCQQSLFLAPTSYSEVFNALHALRKTSSMGSDGITSKVLQLTAHFISQPLAHIINQSFSSGIFPTGFKTAKVVPIFKTGKSDDAQNYRPISILNNLSKIFEKLMSNRMVDFLNKNRILYENQFGFRKGHSTVDAIFSSLNMIRAEKGNKNYALGIFMDLSKAFDTVDHRILLYKLEKYGIRGTPHRWLESYLIDRQQYTIIDDAVSSTKPITVGVPQGSILGPLLFLIYINDIHNACNDVIFKLFADDSNVFVNESNLKDLYNSANDASFKINNWFKSNKLTINCNKSAYILFFPSKEDDEFIVKNNLTLYIDNISIIRVNCVKFLGVLIDEHMNFKQHVESIVKSITSVNGLLYRRRDFIPLSCRKELFFSMVHSRVHYCIEVYGNATWNIIQPLHIACNRVLRTLQGLSRYSNVKDMYIAYDVLPVHLLHKFCIAKLIYKCLNCSIVMPAVINAMFNLNHAPHRYPTKLSKTNYLYKKSGSAFYKSYVNNACTDWNLIPLTIRNAGSLNSFLKQYKSFLFDTW